MNRLSSRKLAGAMAAMLAVVGIVIGSAVVGGVPVEVELTAITAVTGLGGYQIRRQARIDECPLYKVTDDSNRFDIDLERVN